LAIPPNTLRNFLFDTFRLKAPRLLTAFIFILNQIVHTIVWHLKTPQIVEIIFVAVGRYHFETTYLSLPHLSD